MFSLFSGLEPGAVGLALSYALTLTGMFQWGVRQSAEIENMVRTFTSECFTSVFMDWKSFLPKIETNNLQNMWQSYKRGQRNRT